MHPDDFQKRSKNHEFLVISSHDRFDSPVGEYFAPLSLSLRECPKFSSFYDDYNQEIVNDADQESYKLDFE